MSFVTFRDKLLIPLIVGVGGFVLGIFGTEIKDRLFPPETSSSIQTIDFRRDVTFGDYLKVTRNATERFSRTQLARVGFVIFPDIKTTGYKDRRLHVDGTMVDSSHMEVVLSSPPVWGRYVVPPSNTAEQSPDIWIQDPCKPGHYFVDVVVWKGNKAISRKESEPIAVTQRDCRPRGT